MSIRMRHTRGHTGNRRSHHALSATKSVKDSTSGALRLPHRLDETTGMYRGKQIFTPKVKTLKLEKKQAQAPGHTHLPHEHDHAHEAHQHAEQTQGGAKGLLGKLARSSRPKARSGMGGQAS